jgi:hypothetical protein
MGSIGCLVVRGSTERVATQHTPQPASILEVRVGTAETVSRCWDLIGGMRDMGKLLKYAMIVALVAGVIANLPDIKRYIKMSSM